VKKKSSSTTDNVPNPFIQKHQADVIGVLSGFDRLRLTGTLRSLYYPPVMQEYLNKAGVLLKDFKGFVLQVSDRIKAASQRIAEQAKRPLLYLSSSQVSKEKIVADIARRDGIKSGLIGVLSCVEICRSYTVGGNRETKMLDLQLGLRKCLHYYFYYQHPVFGVITGHLLAGGAATDPYRKPPYLAGDMPSNKAFLLLDSLRNRICH
jgi:hypothetical protein